MRILSVMKKIFFALTILSLLTQTTAFADGVTKIRLGWQVPWAVQAQIVQIWKHTDILKQNGLEAEFIGKTFGPALNELAMANAVDVILTGDQPAATLFSKDKGWVGIARLMYNRTATYVPQKSSIRSLKELKGKTIGIPVGAAAERITMSALAKNKVMAKDVKVINLDIGEQAALVKKSSEKWDNFDALSGFDPTPAIFESLGMVKILDVGKVVSLVLTNEAFIKANPGVASKISQALIDAYDYYRLNTTQANVWFMDESHVSGTDQKACDLSASLEPNLKVKNKKAIRVSFNDDDFKRLQEAASFMEAKINKKREES